MYNSDTQYVILEMVFPVTYYQRAMTWRTDINVYKNHQTVAALTITYDVFELFWWRTYITTEYTSKQDNDKQTEQNSNNYWLLVTQESRYSGLQKFCWSIF